MRNSSELIVGEIVGSTALLFGLLGLIIRAIAVGYAARNTSGRNTKKGQVANKLNTTGLYSITRSPLYLGNYFMWLAICCLTGSIWFVLVFSLIFWIYYERIVYAEEAFLREKFGDDYLEWAAKIPVFLPTHFKIIKPARSFNWRRVFRQEKNGFSALFFLFWFFDVLENCIKTTQLL